MNQPIIIAPCVGVRLRKQKKPTEKMHVSRIIWSTIKAKKIESITRDEIFQCQDYSAGETHPIRVFIPSPWINSKRWMIHDSRFEVKSKRKCFTGGNEFFARTHATWDRYPMADGQVRFWQPLKYLLRGNNPRLPGIDRWFLSHIVRAIEYKCTAYLELLIYQVGSHSLSNKQTIKRKGNR
jgi:hypothetical protein